MIVCWILYTTARFARRCLVLIYKTSRDPQNVEGMLATVHLKLPIIDLIRETLQPKYIYPSTKSNLTLSVSALIRLLPRSLIRTLSNRLPAIKINIIPC